MLATIFLPIDFAAQDLPGSKIQLRNIVTYKS